MVAINAPDASKNLELNILNPVGDHLNYTVCCLQQGNASVEVIDLSGKMVIRSNIQVNEGFNRLVLETKNLSRGIYILKFTSQDSIVKTKFVK